MLLWVIMKLLMICSISGALWYTSPNNLSCLRKFVQTQNCTVASLIALVFEVWLIGLTLRRMRYPDGPTSLITVSTEPIWFAWNYAPNNTCQDVFSVRLKFVNKHRLIMVKACFSPTRVWLSFQSQNVYYSDQIHLLLKSKLFQLFLAFRDVILSVACWNTMYLDLGSNALKSGKQERECALGNAVKWSRVWALTGHSVYCKSGEEKLKVNKLVLYTNINC